MTGPKPLDGQEHVSRWRGLAVGGGPAARVLARAMAESRGKMGDVGLGKTALLS